MENIHKFESQKQETPEWFLAHFSGVRHTQGDRWIACCSAHDDRHPSLSIRFNSHCILIHCFAGCSPGDILVAVGLTLADLFFEKWPNPDTRTSQQPRSRIQELETVLFELKLMADFFRERAERFLSVTHGIDTSDWTESQREKVLAMIWSAMEDLQRAERINEVEYRFTQWRRNSKFRRYEKGPTAAYPHTEERGRNATYPARTD